MIQENNSKYFSEITSSVLSNLGIKAVILENPLPTPQLSFSVKSLNALAGIVITASHNPKEYNGYKIYDEFGSQLVPSQAKQVIKFINTITDYKQVNFDTNNELIEIIDNTDNFVDSVLTQSIISARDIKENIKIV